MVEASYDRRRSPQSVANLIADALFIYYLVECLRAPHSLDRRKVKRA